MMSLHRYPDQGFVGDYMRATLGLCLCVPMVLLIRPDSWITGMLMLVAAVCLFLILYTWYRQRTVVAVDQTGIVWRSFLATAIAWSAVTGMSLVYYAPKQDRRHGWMRLTVESGAGSITLDSRIDRFRQIVELAARAARRNQILLSRVTLDNLALLHIDGR